MISYKQVFMSTLNKIVDIFSLNFIAPESVTSVFVVVTRHVGPQLVQANICLRLADSHGGIAGQ